MLQKPYPRDPERLGAEVSAVVKIKDIEKMYELKERVAVKWWESGMVALLFAAGFGFILTASRLIPPIEPFYYWFSLFWVGAIVLSLIFCIEFLIAKFRALRRLYEIQTRILTDMQTELEKINKRLQQKPKEEES